VRDRFRALTAAVVDRLRTPRAHNPRTRKLVLAFALVLFAGATFLAVRHLPPLPADGRQPALFVVVAFLAAMAIVVNGVEYTLSSRAVGNRVGMRDATRISVLATAANLLPIPGAALVKIRALQVRGAGLRIATTLTIAIGIIWVGVAGFVAGVLVATAGGHEAVAAILTALGVGVMAVGGVVLAMQKSEISSVKLVAYAFAIELVSVGLTSLRFFFVLRAIGFNGTLAQAATLAATAVVASAAGIFPSGLGLRELLSSAVGPVVGMSAAVATLVAAVERIAALLVVGLMAVVVMITDRSRADAGDGADADADADLDKHADAPTPGGAPPDNLSRA
jgi:hypothetical protein